MIEQKTIVSVGERAFQQFGRYRTRGSSVIGSALPCRNRRNCQSLSLVSAEPLWAAIWSVMLLLISYCGDSGVAR